MRDKRRRYRRSFVRRKDNKPTNSQTQLPQKTKEVRLAFDEVESEGANHRVDQIRVFCFIYFRNCDRLYGPIGDINGGCW